MAAIFGTESAATALNLTAYIKHRLESRKILLMTHVIVGCPSLEVNWTMLEHMQGADVDIVELQMPFSEPIADGPTFTRANQEALRTGISTQQYFDFMHRATDHFAFPQLMMGYYNTAFRLTHRKFCQRLSEAGGAGFIIPDLPLEEYDDLFDLSEEHGLNPIALMTPTNTDARLAQIGRTAQGFVYGVTRRGVTGNPTDLRGTVLDVVRRYRNATNLPLGLGLGIRHGDDLSHLQGTADIAIIGSALLEEWERGGAEGYRGLLEELQAARF